MQHYAKCTIVYTISFDLRGKFNPSILKLKNMKTFKRIIFTTRPSRLSVLMSLPFIYKFGHTVFYQSLTTRNIWLLYFVFVFYY